MSSVLESLMSMCGLGPSKHTREEATRERDETKRQISQHIEHLKESADIAERAAREASAQAANAKRAVAFDQLITELQKHRDGEDDAATDNLY